MAFCHTCKQGARQVKHDPEPNLPGLPLTLLIIVSLMAGGLLAGIGAVCLLWH